MDLPVLVRYFHSAFQGILSGKYLKPLVEGRPGYFIWKVFETLGGRTTTFSVSLVAKVSVVVSVASVAAVIVAWAKMNQQKKELVRCRERIGELENLVSDTQNSENKP